jgi:hypothetical protein
MEFEWDKDKAIYNLKSLVHAKLLAEKGKYMKKKIRILLKDELRSEYDKSLLKGGIRSKYTKQYKEGTNLILLAPDVAEAFPSNEAVNEALRLLIKIAKKSTKQLL